MKSLYASEVVKQVIWNDFISHFRSETTKASYQTDLDELMNYLKKDFLGINRMDVQAFYDWMKHRVEKEEIKPATMAKKFRECHSFSEHICENAVRYQVSEHFQDFFYPYLPLLVKQEKHVKGIPVEEIDRLFLAAQDNLMVYCILAMLYRMGLSSTEVVELKFQDLEEYADGIYVQVEARKMACFVPDDVVWILTKYLEQREDNPYLFYNKKGGKLNTMYISRMMKKYTALAGISPYSAENIRNSCGLTMFAYGAKEKQVAEQMGITQIQIKRYNNVFYKKNLQRQAQSLVKLRLEPPE